MVARTSYFAFAILVFAVLTAATFGQQGAAQPQPAEKKPTVEQLIDRLDSNDFATREAATRELLDRDDATAALQKALESDKPEVRRRAESVLAKRKDRLYQRMTERILVHIKNGEVDQFVDQLAALDGPVDERIWEALQDLALRIQDPTGKERAKKGFHPPGVIEAWKEHPENFTTAKRLPADPTISLLRLVVPEITKKPELHHSIVVCQGRIEGVDASDSYLENIIFTNGNIKSEDFWWHCVVVCDGNLDVSVAQGVYIATGKIKEGSSQQANVHANVREALGVVKFFNTKQVGVEVADTGGAVVVKKVLDDLAFAKAGFKEGDRVLAADGKKIANFDEFRRRVRRNAMANKPVTFTVRRGDKDLELTVPLTDY